LTSGLTLEDLASRTGETPERLVEWRSAGLLPGEPFVGEDVECVRLIRFCLGRGFDVATIARAEREQPGFLREYVAQLFPSGPQPTYSPTEAAALTGADADLIGKLLEISGPTSTKDAVGERDLEAIRGWKIARKDWRRLHAYVRGRERRGGVRPRDRRASVRRRPVPGHPGRHRIRRSTAPRITGVLLSAAGDGVGYGSSS
jgi:hypothetical protein